MTGSDIDQFEDNRGAELPQGLIDVVREERFDRITRLACEALAVPVAGIAIVDRQHVWFKSASGVLGGELPSTPGLVTYASLSPDSVVIPDLRADPQFMNDLPVNGHAYPRFFASVPITGPGAHRFGEFCVFDREPRMFPENSLQTLRDLAIIAASEFQICAMTQVHSELTAELDTVRRQLLRDNLTQTWNRAGILEVLTREQSRARRNRQRLGIALVDVDEFKLINDNHGHLAGDRVLRTVAERMLEAVRSYDAVGRFGGDEFLVVIVNPDRDILAKIAERIRHNIAQTPIVCNSRAFSITASIGVAKLDVQQATELDQLIQVADEALYSAKRDGRNRVVIAP